MKSRVVRAERALRPYLERFNDEFNQREGLLGNGAPWLSEDRSNGAIKRCRAMFDGYPVTQAFQPSVPH